MTTVGLMPGVLEFLGSREDLHREIVMYEYEYSMYSTRRYGL